MQSLLSLSLGSVLQFLSLWGQWGSLSQSGGNGSVPLFGCNGAVFLSLGKIELSLSAWKQWSNVSQSGGKRAVSLSGAIKQCPSLSGCNEAISLLGQWSSLLSGPGGNMGAVSLWTWGQCGALYLPGGNVSYLRLFWVGLVGITFYSRVYCLLLLCVVSFSWA